MHVEAQAQDILKNLARLSGDFERFRTDFELVGKHLTNTKTKYDDADKRLAKFGDRLHALNGAEADQVIEEAEKLPL
jgi:DNA anti-recombination protein RmuC